MASTVLPNGIIIPEKYSRDWYNDLYHNWQELDNLLGGGTPKDGTLTIQKNGTTVGTFSANQSTNETIDITVPDVNNGTLTIQKNGTTVGTFSANQETNETINIVVPDALPTGSYIQFAGSQAPDGFLVCNGGEISRTTYSKLFSVIGTTYGSGDGSTTFNLPNLIDKFLEGSGTAGTEKTAGLPSIRGKFGTGFIVSNNILIVTTRSPEGCFYGSGQTTDRAPDGNISTSTNSREINIDASRSSSVYGNSTTVQPPALTCLICIKY